MSQPQNYQEASGLLTGRCKNRRKLANNTYLERRSEQIAVKLHTTDIITYSPNGEIELNSGGWQTVTTKERLNRYAPVCIWQENSIWYVSTGGAWSADPDRYLYADGLIIGTDGVPTNAKKETKADRKAVATLKRRIAKFAKLCADNCIGIRPSGGDCWYCALTSVEDGRPLGECTHNTDHLDSHMVEKYPVPSLIYRACERFGASQATMSALYHGADAGFWTDHAKQSVQKVVRRYMYEQFGMAS